MFKDIFDRVQLVYGKYFYVFTRRKILTFSILPAVLRENYLIIKLLNIFFLHFSIINYFLIKNVSVIN